MSRLRKGKKFKGGSFAQTFRQGISSNTPFAKVVVADQGGDEEPQDLETRQQEAAGDDINPKTRTELGPKDEIPSDTDYSREEVDAYFQRRKLAKEQEALDKAKREQEEQAASEADEEAAAAEEEREATSQGENIAGSFENEYDPTMTGKKRRAESKENKQQIRDAKKTAKQTAKQEFKDKKQAIKDSGVKGSAKRQAKKAARKDKRADKKSIRQNKRAAKKSNRKAKRKARRKGRK